MSERIVLYKNALEDDANDLSACNRLATAYQQSGSLDSAEQEFQKASLQNPSYTTSIAFGRPSLSIKENRKRADRN